MVGNTHSKSKYIKLCLMTIEISKSLNVESNYVWIKASNLLKVLGHDPANF